MVNVGDRVVVIATTNFNGLRGVVIEDDANNSEELRDIGLVLVMPLEDRPDGYVGPFYWNESSLEVEGSNNPLNLG